MAARMHCFLENSEDAGNARSVHAKRQFTVKVGTIFEDSPISLDKWLTAVWMLANCKNGVSSYEVARAIGVTQKSAWFMLHRLRLGPAKLAASSEARRSWLRSRSG